MSWIEVRKEGKTPLESITHVEDEGHDLLLSREEKSLTLSVVIVNAATHFKRRRVYTSLTNHPQAPPIEAPDAIFPLPQLPALSSRKRASMTSTKSGTIEFQDIFVDLALGYNSFNFSTLTGEKWKLIEAMVEGRTCLRNDSLEVVTNLERAFTIPLNISTMSDENFHRYLVLTIQIAFNVGIKRLIF